MPGCCRGRRRRRWPSAATPEPRATTGAALSKTWTELEIVREKPAAFRAGRRIHVAFKEGGWVYNYLVDHKASTHLVVFLPSAMPKAKRLVPSFHRHSWSDSLACSTICVSDPTLRLNEELLGGWFLGRHDDHVLRHVAGHLEAFAGQLGVRLENVLFAGSSLGGFAAIALATLLRGAHAYAENPQTDLRRYLAGPLATLDRHCFGGRMAHVAQAQPQRFSLLDLFAAEGYTPSFMMIQKASDDFHLQHHALPFIRTLIDTGRFAGHFEVMPASADPSGHTPLTREQFLLRARLILPIS